MDDKSQFVIGVLTRHYKKHNKPKAIIELRVISICQALFLGIVSVNGFTHSLLFKMSFSLFRIFMNLTFGLLQIFFNNYC